MTTKKKRKEKRVFFNFCFCSAKSKKKKTYKQNEIITFKISSKFTLMLETKQTNSLSEHTQIYCTQVFL